MPTIEGKIISALEPRSGQNARGTWMVQEFLLESSEQPYPRKCLFSIFGAERLQAFNLQVGEYVAVDVDIDAREYNGRYYNSVRAWRVTRVPEPAPAGMPMPGMPPMGAGPAAPMPPIGAPAPTSPAAPIGAAPATAPVAPAAAPAAPAQPTDPFAGGGDSDDLPF